VELYEQRVIPAATLILLLGTAAHAQNVHLNKDPTFVDNGLSLTAMGIVNGLGSSSQGANVFLTASANATATCTNPSGANKPPGHNPAPVSVSGGTTIQPGAINHNGGAPFSVTTNPPGPTIDPTSSDFSCPGSNWTETITDLAFTSADIMIAGTHVAHCTFSDVFNGGTADGTVTKGEFSCTLF
jgi:hypothetical protein